MRIEMSVSYSNRYDDVHYIEQFGEKRREKRKCICVLMFEWIDRWMSGWMDEEEQNSYFERKQKEEILKNKERRRLLC